MLQAREQGAGANLVRQTGQDPPFLASHSFRHLSQNQWPQWVGLQAPLRTSEHIGHIRSCEGVVSNTVVPSGAWA